VIWRSIGSDPEPKEEARAVTRHDPHYEAPTAEVISTEAGPSATAAGPGTDVYGAITLMEEDGKTRRKRRRRRILSRKPSSGD
jgi:hypothetical protein